MENQEDYVSTPRFKAFKNIESLKDTLVRRVHLVLNDVNDKRKRDDQFTRDFVQALEALMAKTIKHAEDTIFEKYSHHKQIVELGTQNLFSSLDSTKNLLAKMNKVLFSLCSYTQLLADDCGKSESKSALNETKDEVKTPLVVTVNIITEKLALLTSCADKFMDEIRQKRNRDMTLIEEFLKSLDGMVQKYYKVMEDFMFKTYSQQNVGVETALRQIYVNLEHIDTCKDTFVDTQLKLKDFLGQS